MAFKRLTIDGFGQIEINNCAFRRDGRIEAQCKPGSDFANKPVENGMLLNVDNIARQVKYATDSKLPVALVYSAEHMYDERQPGLNSFSLKGANDFLPRLGYPAVGDKFTSNCVGYSSDEWSDDTAFTSALNSYATVTLYGGISADGAIAVSTVAPTWGPVLLVTKKTTMPDGTLGIKFQVIAD